MPPDGAYSSAPERRAASSAAWRRRSSASAPTERTTTWIPASSRATRCSRTASCEAASTTAAGRAATSAARPAAYATPNSRASSLARAEPLRPASATISTPGSSPPRTCSSTSRAIVPAPSNATRIERLLGRREFCHSSIISPRREHNVRIAILEDDPDQLALLRRWLDEDGHDVHAYISGRETMKHAGRESFDLFLLDWQEQIEAFAARVLHGLAAADIGVDVMAVLV